MLHCLFLQIFREGLKQGGAFSEGKQRAVGNYPGAESFRFGVRLCTPRRPSTSLSAPRGRKPPRPGKNAPSAGIVGDQAYRRFRKSRRKRHLPHNGERDIGDLNEVAPAAERSLAIAEGRCKRPAVGSESWRNSTLRGWGKQFVQFASCRVRAE